MKVSSSKKKKKKQNLPMAQVEWNPKSRPPTRQKSKNIETLDRKWPKGQNFIIGCPRKQNRFYKL